MAEHTDIRLFIQDSPWFDGIPERELDSLTSGSSLRDFDAGAHVWNVGDTTSSLYGLMAGRIRLYQTSESGQEYALIDWEDGAWFGEQCLAVDEPHMLGVAVLAPSRVVVIPRRSVLSVADSWPQLHRNLFRSGWKNTRGLYEIISSVVFYPLRARVAGRVLQLIEEHGTAVNDGVLLNIKLSQSDFARLTMGSRQRVNTVFRDWTRQGLIDYRDEHLLIKSVSGLAREITPFD